MKKPNQKYFPILKGRLSYFDNWIDFTFWLWYIYSTGGYKHMTDNELLLAISEMMDSKLKSELQPLKNDIQSIKNEVHQIKLYQENVILPRLNTIESCYTDTYNRYRDYADKMDAAFADIELLKKVVTEHSEKLQKLA